MLSTSIAISPRELAGRGDAAVPNQGRTRRPAKCSLSLSLRQIGLPFLLPRPASSAKRELSIARCARMIRMMYRARHHDNNNFIITYHVARRVSIGVRAIDRRSEGSGLRSPRAPARLRVSPENVTMRDSDMRVNEEHFWIYFRLIEGSRPSTRTDLINGEEKRKGEGERAWTLDFFSLSLSRSVRAARRVGGDQSVILLRGLFRVAISFPLKWPDPIRSRVGPRTRARVRAA